MRWAFADAANAPLPGIDLKRQRGRPLQGDALSEFGCTPFLDLQYRLTSTKGSVLLQLPIPPDRCTYRTLFLQGESVPQGQETEGETECRAGMGANERGVRAPLSARPLLIVYFSFVVQAP